MDITVATQIVRSTEVDAMYGTLSARERNLPTDQLLRVRFIASCEDNWAKVEKIDDELARRGEEPF